MERLAKNAVNRLTRIWRDTIIDPAVQITDLRPKYCQNGYNGNCNQQQNQRILNQSLSAFTF
jgi:hypothetical protein